MVMAPDPHPGCGAPLALIAGEGGGRELVAVRALARRAPCPTAGGEPKRPLHGETGPDPEGQPRRERVARPVGVDDRAWWVDRFVPPASAVARLVGPATNAVGPNDEVRR